MWWPGPDTQALQTGTIVDLIMGIGDHPLRYACRTDGDDDEVTCHALSLSVLPYCCSHSVSARR